VWQRRECFSLRHEWPRAPVSLRSQRPSASRALKFRSVRSGRRETSRTGAALDHPCAARRRRWLRRDDLSPRPAIAPARAAPRPPADLSTRQSSTRDHPATQPPNYPATQLQNNLVERIFDDALAACRLELRNQVTHRALLDDRVHGNPLVVAQRRDRWPL